MLCCRLWFTDLYLKEGAVFIANYLKNHNKLHSLGVSLNRLGDKGAQVLSLLRYCSPDRWASSNISLFVQLIADALKDEQTLERFSIASNRLSHVGAAAIAEGVKHHPKLQFLDFGFTKATSVLGELGNIIGDEVTIVSLESLICTHGWLKAVHKGAKSIAELLKVNKTLRSLDLLHNSIGLQYLKEGLKENTSLVNLVTTQFGKVHNEVTKEEIKQYLARNRSLVPEDELKELDNLAIPEHIAEVYSVYRTHM